MGERFLWLEIDGCAMAEMRRSATVECARRARRLLRLERGDRERRVDKKRKRMTGGARSQASGVPNSITPTSLGPIIAVTVVGFSPDRITPGLVPCEDGEYLVVCVGANIVDQGPVFLTQEGSEAGFFPF